MAVDKNPYISWQALRNSSDYRSKETQLAALTRQQLSQSDYLLSSSRVNPGPGVNRRRNLADNASQLPHPTGSEDMWGWQSWAEVSVSTAVPSNLASGLREEVSKDSIPGANYEPLTGEVGGASS